jgi:hypothetical protein
MRTFTFALIAIILGLMSGCATVPPQGPVEVSQSRLADPAIRIGVMMSPMPKVDTFFPGADCLLCLAAASVANSSLTRHTQALATDDLRSLKSEVSELLRKRGAMVIAINDDLKVRDLPKAKTEGPNRARKDFSALKSQYQVDKLLVIELDTVGMWRTYAAYFPTSDPKAIVSGRGYIVNLADNSYEWYEGFNFLRAADGKWDEPPTFPGLTNAYYQAVEASRDAIKKPFTK